MNRRILILSATAVAVIGLSSCASHTEYVQHKKYGVVTTEDKNYEKDRAACEMKSFPRTYWTQDVSGGGGKSKAREIKVANLRELAVSAFDEYRYTQTPVSVTAAAVSTGNTSAAAQSAQPKKVDGAALPASKLLSEVMVEINSCIKKAGWSAVSGK